MAERDPKRTAEDAIHAIEEEARHAEHEAERAAQKAWAHAEGAARDVGRAAHDAANDGVDRAFDATAAGVDRMADATADAARGIGQDGAFDGVSEVFEDAADGLRDTDLDSLGRSVSDFAHRHPFAFAAGAAALGYAAARMFPQGDDRRQAEADRRAPGRRRDGRKA